MMRLRTVLNIFFVFVLLYLPVYSHNYTDVLKLEVNGIVTHDGKAVSRAIITTILDSAVIDQIITKRSGKFDLFLEYRKEYILEVSKEGFVTKQIIISTNIPDKIIKEGGAGFYDLNIPMIELIKGLNTTVFNNPVEKYVFVPETFYYSNDKNFESTIRNQIAAVLQQLEKLKIKEYEHKIQYADQLKTENDLENAWALYTKALKLFPDKSYPKSQIKELKKLIKNELSLNEAYENAIEKADKYYENSEYLKAEDYYEKALLYKENELYPVNRISDIDSINTQLYLAKKKAYDNEIANANSYIKTKEYKKARNSLEKAIEILPDEQSAKSKLEEVINMEAIYYAAINKKNDAEYFSICKRADSCYANNKYYEAKKLYEKCLSLKPEEKYPAKKIDEIEKHLNRQEDLANKEKEKRERENKEYQLFINEGDEEFKALNYESAKEEYENAQKIKPGESYPKQKISELNNLLAQKAQEKAQTKTLKEQKNKLASDELSKKEPKKEEIPSYIELAQEKEKKGDSESAGNIYSNIGNVYHNNNQIKQALKFYEKSLELKKEAGDKVGASLVLNDIAVAYYDSGRFDNAVEKYKEALDINKEIGNRKISSIVLDNIGQVYENTFQYDNAVKYYEQSLDIVKELDDKNEEAILHEKVANIYLEQNEFEKAIESYKQTLKIDEELKDEKKTGATLNNIGVAYHTIGKYNDAVNYYEKSLDLNQKAGDKMQISIALNNIGNVNYDWKKYSKAIEFYEKSIEIKEDINYKIGQAISLHNIGNAYKGLKKYNQAINYYKQSNNIAKEINSQEVQARNFKAFSEVYSLVKDYKNAYKYQRLFTESKHTIKDEKSQMFEGVRRERTAADKILIASLRHQIQRQKLLAEYEANQRMKEIEIKNLEIKSQNEQLKRMRLQISLAFVLIIACVIFTILIFNQYRQKKKANIILTEKNELISFQKQQITDSIRYASRIQKAVLPPEEYVKKIIPQHFILNKPRDIVSGDYYWTTQLGSESIIAVADCTGHGVPGAFMSMLGISFLNEIVNKSSNAKSHEILNQLREHVMNSLHQTGKDEETKDGMDIALCVIDTKKKELQYSGAHNPLYLIRSDELTEIKADKMPIGISMRYTQPFKNNKMKLDPGDVLYIFSDGYCDQFGGESKKKFGVRRFKEFLLEIHHEPMNKQCEKLDQQFLEWRGMYDQLDDVLVVGIKID